VSVFPFMLGAAAGNFIYQGWLAGSTDWSVAVDRSFFQCIALGVYALALRAARAEGRS
jgi:hypothetical protein